MTNEQQNRAVAEAMGHVVPCPRKDGKCSSDCPLHSYDHQPGWPIFEECLAWEPETDGEEPWLLADDAICKPALRLAESTPT